jgi:hypothetical protein
LFFYGLNVWLAGAVCGRLLLLACLYLIPFWCFLYLFLRFSANFWLAPGWVLFAPSQLLLRFYRLLDGYLHGVWTSFASEFPVSCFVCACYFDLCSSVFFSVWCCDHRLGVGVRSCPHVTDPGFPCSGSFGYCCFLFHVVVWLWLNVVW